MQNDHDIEPNQNTSVKKSRLVKMGSLLLTLLVIGVIVIFYSQNYGHFQAKSHRESAPNAITQLQMNVTRLTQQTEQLTGQVNNQDQIINTLRQTQTGKNRDEWRVIEAEFLAKLANDKLQYENNINQAIVLLQASDQEIRDLNDARFLVIRKAIAEDIANLQALTQVDVPGVYSRLSAVNDQINAIPLPNKPVEKGEITTTTNENLPWWKRGLNQTWDALRQIVIVRYNQTGALPLVTPDQQAFLFQNLHSMIERAMWGLLHQQSEIYQSSLQQATGWINQYFVLDSPAKQSVLSALKELQEINVLPEAPKSSQSLQAFKEYFSTQGITVENQPIAVKPN